MLHISVLRDPAIKPVPTYGPDDAANACTAPDTRVSFIHLQDAQTLSRECADVVVVPYHAGDLSGAPLDGLLSFHEQGGGLVFLGDTPNAGPAFPFRHSLAPEFRLTKCRDHLTLRGLTDEGRRILGDLPGLADMQDRPAPCVRTSAFPPDDCRILVQASAHLKDLGPVVLVERRHPRFLGARLAVAGFDGGEPRENTMGVCNLPWKPDFAMLDRAWPGSHALVDRLARAVAPAAAGIALEFHPVDDADNPLAVSLRLRNLTSLPLNLAYELATNPQKFFSYSGQLVLSPGATTTIDLGAFVPPLGPIDLTATVRIEVPNTTLAHTRTHFRSGKPRPLCMGFSTYRAFRTPTVDAAYRDFLHHTAKLGMQYVRMALPWEDLEPEPGRYDWTIADQMLAAASEEKLVAYIWIFPTARGSGLGDGGIPAWALREPSIDRHGKPGNFPCIWSPFYRTRYFAFLEAVAKRYARDPRIERFVCDFGNSDFPYAYHYYGDRSDRFDYSPHEKKAFAAWLEAQDHSLADLSARWGRPFHHYNQVPVPYPEQVSAWLLYDAFRTWGVYQGIKDAVDIVRRFAPEKTPPDPPGHGLGSIADIQTYIHQVQARHWDEVMRQPKHLVEAHNMGPTWGGEPWQVGGTWRDYDDAVFQSVRLEADYFTVPGPDLGLWEKDLGRAAMIRRTMSGARRAQPEIAIMDHIPWHQFDSLAQLGTRLDQPVDLLSHTCRFDYSRYKLLVLPPNELITTEKGTTSLLPLDAGFYTNILQAVENGLRVLVFPDTGRGDTGNPFRRTCGLDDVAYGARRSATIQYPERWGGGTGTGHVRTVIGRDSDSAMLTDDAGEIVVLFRPHGKGGFVLCGYDRQPDSLDSGYRYDESTSLSDHTLARLLHHDGLDRGLLQTGQTCCFKERLFSPERDYLLLFSHQPKPLPLTVRFQSQRAPASLLDLADGRRYPVEKEAQAGVFRLVITLEPRRGYYLVVENGRAGPTTGKPPLHTEAK